MPSALVSGTLGHSLIDGYHMTHVPSSGKVSLEVIHARTLLGGLAALEGPPGGLEPCCAVIVATPTRVVGTREVAA